LELLSQAARGLEYLHSQCIVHSDVNPLNIMICEDGTTGSTKTSSKPGVVRYMAPEQIDPLGFGLPNGNPTKESDVYSFAMTAYEVLTEVEPYANAHDGDIIIKVLAGNRPPRPQGTRWLLDPIWDMIKACWSKKPELRWDMSVVSQQLSVSNIREVVEDERGSQHVSQTSTRMERTITPLEIQIVQPIFNIVGEDRRQNMSSEQLPIIVEVPLGKNLTINQVPPTLQPRPGDGSPEPESSIVSQVEFPQSTPGTAPESGFTSPYLGHSTEEFKERPQPQLKEGPLPQSKESPQTQREEGPQPQPKQGPQPQTEGTQSQPKRKQKLAIWSLQHIRRAFNTLKGVFRRNKSPRTNGRPSK